MISRPNLLVASSPVLSAFCEQCMLHCSQKALKTGEDATSKFGREIMVDGNIVTVGFAGNSKAHYQFVHNQLQGFTKAITSQPFKYVLFTGIDKKAEDDDRTTIGGV